MQAIADLRGWSPLIALQIEYSLIERTVERDLIPMAKEMDLGVIPWSPLASGVLSGKYTRDDLNLGASGDSGTRRDFAIANGVLTEGNLAIADVVREVATEINKTPSQVALAWTLLEPGVTAPIVGARTVAQFEDNLGALDVVLSEGQRARLNAVSAVDLGFPHEFLARATTRKVMFGDLILAR